MKKNVLIQKIDGLLRVLRERSNKDLVATQTNNKTLLDLRQIQDLTQWRSLVQKETDETLPDALRELLARRWQSLKDSPWHNTYTELPTDPFNQLCVEIARDLDPTQAYILLMPTLTTNHDINGQSLQALSLHQFVLSDDHRVWIPVGKCLTRATSKEMTTCVGDNQCLTPTETQRIINHSHLTQTYYTLLQQTETAMAQNLSLGKRLNNLAYAFWLGRNEEGNALEVAQAAGERFLEYWDGLPAAQKRVYARSYGWISNIIAGIKASRCVDLMQKEIYAALSRYQTDDAIYDTNNDAEEATLNQAKHSLQDELSKPNYPLADPRVSSLAACVSASALPFAEHCLILEAKIAEFALKAQDYQVQQNDIKMLKYVHAQSVVDELLTKIKQAQREYLQSTLSPEDKIALFRTSCLDAIRCARDSVLVTEQREDWSNFFEWLIAASHALGRLVSTGQFGLFVVKTRSARMLDVLENAASVYQLPSSAG